MDFSQYPRFKTNGNAAAESVQETVEELGLPNDYAELLVATNGGAGFVGEEYVVLFRAEELVELNSNYKIDEFFPGIVLIGNSGGSEAIAFDKRQEPCYILIPFLFEEEAIIELGGSIVAMFQKIATQGYFG